MRSTITPLILTLVVAACSSSGTSTTLPPSTSTSTSTSPTSVPPSDTTQPPPPATTATTGPATTTSTTATSTLPGTTGTTVQVTERCSATDEVLPPDPFDQEGLPDELARLRATALVLTARCDYDGLAALAVGGPSTFTYSFGDSGDPAAFWRGAEDRGEAPMRFLVRTLQLPYGTMDVDGEVHYVWPSAATFPDWASVPEVDRGALRALYGPQEFVAFEAFGAFIGFRFVATASGDWTAFVTGD